MTTAMQRLWEWIDANYHEDNFNLNDARDMSLKLENEQIEISDDEILKAAKECVYNDLDISVGSFELGARWYREQLKNKQ